MRNSLHVKFFILYLIFAFMCTFCVSSVTRELFLNHLEEKTATTIYREATEFSSDFLPSYFSEEITYSELYLQLRSIHNILESNVWLVDRNGVIIASCTLIGQSSAPSSVPDFNPAEIGSQLYLVGNYHGHFSNDVITVITPVTNGFTTNGYLLVHTPYTAIEEDCDQLLTAVWVTLAVILLFAMAFVFAMNILVNRPMEHLTEAAKQYALGNLNHEIPIHSEDEFGYLSDSLNYMSSQLKDLENAQRNFVANVSHDFRSPLTSIKGYLEAMADGTIPVEMQDRYFKIILFETERLTDLTKDLLTLNEFDTRELILNYEDFDIHEVIKNTARSFEGICTKRHISVELLFATKVLNVNADKSKIQQVLYNLLDNAIKFSHDDSSIIIETTDRNGKISVSVKDRGIGIPKKSIQKIWDRFYKTDLSRGKDKRGTGLGLAIVKEVIQAHNENIHVVSTEDVGTEFTFTLKKTV